MKKDLIAVPLLPFTDEEEAALVDRMAGMSAAALGHYVESAKLSLGNRALDPSWQPRIAMGLARAEAALLTLSLLPPPPVEPVASVDADEPVPAPAPKKSAKAKAAAAAAAAAAVPIE